MIPGFPIGLICSKQYVAISMCLHPLSTDDFDSTILRINIQHRNIFHEKYNNLTEHSTYALTLLREPQRDLSPEGPVTAWWFQASLSLRPHTHATFVLPVKRPESLAREVVALLVTRAQATEASATAFQGASSQSPALCQVSQWHFRESEITQYT